MPLVVRWWWFALLGHTRGVLPAPDGTPLVPPSIRRRLQAAPHEHASGGRFDCAPPPDASDIPIVRCNKTENLVGHDSLRGKPIRFVHVPKCGTSFVNTVVRLSCPPDVVPPWAAIRLTDPGKVGGALVQYYYGCLGVNSKRCGGLRDGVAKHLIGHSPVGHNEVKLLERREVAYVILVRDPYSRLVSNFHQRNRVKVDCPSCDKNPTLDAFASSHTQSARRDGPAGCATKMLIGRQCGGSYPTRAEADEAQRRLRLFAFVGVTEFWEQSVCAAHAALDNYHSPVYSTELSNTRPTVASSTVAATPDDLADDLRRRTRSDANFTDWADEELYLLALELLERSCCPEGLGLEVPLVDYPSSSSPSSYSSENNFSSSVIANQSELIAVDEDAAETTTSPELFQPPPTTVSEEPSDR